MSRNDRALRTLWQSCCITASDMDRPSDQSPHDDQAIERLRLAVTDLELRLRSLEPGALRHDVRNALGAARNALALVDEGSLIAERRRFVEMIDRNLRRAAQLLAGEPARTESARNERNDLGGSGEREHRGTLGL